MTRKAQKTSLSGSVNGIMRFCWNNVDGRASPELFSFCDARLTIITIKYTVHGSRE